jgi:hypothetical protein
MRRGFFNMVVPCPCRFGACHSEERSDEESQRGRTNARFFASTAFRLRMTAHTFSVDTAVGRASRTNTSGARVHPTTCLEV